MLQSKQEIAIGAGPIFFQPVDYFGRQFNGGFGGILQAKFPGLLFLNTQPFGAFTVFLDSAFLFSTQSLADRSTGSMTTFSLTAGPGLLYPLHPLFQPVASLQAGLFYNRLTLGARDEVYHAYNPALRLQAGFHSVITGSLFLESRVALPFYYLGERNLAGPEIALTVNYLLRPGEIIMTRSDKHFLEGKRLYEAGKLAEADVEFSSALKSDSAHPGALNYRRMIGAQEQLVRARAARERQETWSALANYQQAAAHLSQAEQELREYRATLAATVPAMVTEAIAHYEARRYAECERLMEHTLLIQPDNEQARIYLPRARSRRQALEKLQ
ncbi:MAG: hypothetical protein ACOY5B_08565 [Spirochaetota bacterium]